MFLDHSRVELLSGVSGSKSNDNIDTSTTANTKGSWTSLVSATAHEYQGLIVNIPQTEIVNDYLLDIAIQKPGGSGQEVIAPDLLVPMRKDTHQCIGPYKLLVHVPEGSEIFGRAQRSGSGARWISPTLHGITQGFRGFRGGSYYVNLGALTATSRGTVMSPDAVANQYPAAYTTLAASNDHDLHHIILAVDTVTSTSLSDANYQVEISYGANDQPVIDAAQFSSGTAHDLVLPFTQDFFCFIPGGNAIKARVRSSSTSQDIGLAAYGLVGL